MKCEKKNKGTTKCKKKPSHVMLELHNVRMKPSSVRKKSKETIQYNKETVICDVGTAQCEKKKVRKPPNVRKNCNM